VRGRKMPVTVLDQVQKFDQQVALARPVAEQRLNLVESIGIDLPPLRLRTGTTPLATSSVLADFSGGLRHSSRLLPDPP
jgi:hypothetical protein